MEITRIYRQHLPARRFVGKKYGDEDRSGGGFGHKWGEFWANDWFGVLERAAKSPSTEGYEDGDAYVGLMRWKDGEPFEYWIGMFLPADTDVPEGFASVDFPESDLGIGWIHGGEGEVYGHEEEVGRKVEEEGMRILPDETGAFWFFERYGCPRFTTPDADGKIILDIGHFVE